MLRKATIAKPEDRVTPEEEVKDPYLLEFLDLKDEYSEAELESALIAKLETLLLELGGDFTFAGRQRRLRIGDEWYRIDLLFFHRRLRCLVIIDLKVGKFTHADAGQMHLYLNYAREHWTLPGPAEGTAARRGHRNDEAPARNACQIEAIDQADSSWQAALGGLFRRARADPRDESSRLAARGAGDHASLRSARLLQGSVARWLR